MDFGTGRGARGAAVADGKAPHQARLAPAGVDLPSRLAELWGMPVAAVKRLRRIPGFLTGLPQETRDKLLEAGPTKEDIEALAKAAKKDGTTFLEADEMPEEEWIRF